jgi:mRNA interferase MazF
VKRGDVVITVSAGDYGKPRPAVIVQADSYVLASFTIAPLTTEIHDAPLLRILVEPDATNGLQKPSQIMIDKISTVSRAKIGQQIGSLERATMQRVNRALVSFFDLGDTAA